jgi:esterase/lipase superfamily enzyme
MVAALGGCASLPPASSCTVGEMAADGSSLITVYYATNRTLSPGAAPPEFSFGRGRDLQFGALRIAVPPAATRNYGSISGIRIVGVRTFATEQQFAQALRTAMGVRTASLRSAAGDASPRRLLTYIHGYNNKFGDAAVRLAQFTQDGCLKHVPVLMSWPSRGAVLDYEYDEDSATYSRPYLGQTLELVSRAAGSRRVDILAHSMGNWLALDTLRQWAYRRPVERFGIVVFASPDVDLDVFTQGINDTQRRGGVAEIAVLMTNQRDRVLALASFLSHGEPRAGDATRKQIEDAGLKTSKRFAILFVRRPELDSCGPGGHDCYSYDPVMLRKLRDLVANSDISGTRKQPPLEPLLLPLQLPGAVINSVQGVVAQ